MMMTGRSGGRAALALLFALALSVSACALGEAFPEAFPAAESFPTAESPAAAPDAAAFPQEDAAPYGEAAAETAIEAAEGTEAADFTLVPQGGDGAERIFAQALSAWAQGARTVRSSTGGVMLLDEKTPVYTLSSSAAYRTREGAYLSSPGDFAGMEQAAAQFLGELNANQQSLSLEPTAEKPFRGSFMPTGFTLRLSQAVYDAAGAVTMDCAILALTDAGGNPLEDPAYAFVRFFREGDAVLWLAADPQMVQTVAQMNQIRTSGAGGLTYSQVLEGEDAPRWSSNVKSIANGSAYNPDAAGFTMGQSASPVQTSQGATGTAGVSPVYGALDTAGSFDAGAAVTPEPTPQVQYVTVREGVTAASIRESPTTNSRRIAMAYPGVQYEFLGVTDYSWVTVMTADGLYGYISPRLVGPLPGEETGPRVTVTKSMTIHEEPTYYSNEPSSVRAGRSYYVVNDKMGEWVQIRNTDGSIGYINRQYIR